MKKALFTAIALMLSLAASMALAQAPTADHLTRRDLLEKANALQQSAAATGSASAKLAEYPHHYTMIAMRQKSGGAEIHQNYADLCYVLKGHATLVTGGTVLNPQEATPGEIRGTAVQNGTETALRPGDFFHIPATVPHQLLVSKHQTFIYYVIKVQEK